VIYAGVNFFQQAGPGSISASGMLGVELAPTKVRGIVQSMTVASGRIGASLTAFVFPALIAAYGVSTALVVLGVLALVALLITVAFIPETKKRSLEEASGEDLVGQMQVLSD
jgi:putative MFS transporter